MIKIEKVFDLVGKEISVGDTVIAHIQNHIQYVKVTEILNNGLLKTNKEHYCLFSKKVILLEKQANIVN